MCYACITRRMLMIVLLLTLLCLAGCPTKPPYVPPPGNGGGNNHTTKVNVPNVVGSFQQVAESMIPHANLTVGSITTKYHAMVPAGKVLNQSPEAGSSVPVESPVSLSVSLGPEYPLALLEAGDTETVLLPGNVPLVMVWIPKGTFLMGAPVDDERSTEDERPQHQVTLTQGFWMGKYELTKRQWRAVMNTEPWFNDTMWPPTHEILDHPDSPAEHICWDHVQNFMQVLSDRTGIAFRMPTEAQWEYACRAGTTERFYWGHDPEFRLIDKYAWYSGNTTEIGASYPHVVGLKLPNAWGLYDMLGNVHEWTSNWTSFMEGYDPGLAIDPTGPETGTYKVARGGAWWLGPPGTRATERFYGYPAYSMDGRAGVRLAH